MAKKETTEEKPDRTARTLAEAEAANAAREILSRVTSIRQRGGELRQVLARPEARGVALPAELDFPVLAKEIADAASIFEAWAR